MGIECFGFLFSGLDWTGGRGVCVCVGKVGLGYLTVCFESVLGNGEGNGRGGERLVEFGSRLVTW